MFAFFKGFIKSKKGVDSKVLCRITPIESEDYEFLEEAPVVMYDNWKEIITHFMRATPEVTLWRYYRDGYWYISISGVSLEHEDSAVELSIDCLNSSTVNSAIVNIVEFFTATERNRTIS